MSGPVAGPSVPLQALGSPYGDHFKLSDSQIVGHSLCVLTIPSSGPSFP